MIGDILGGALDWAGGLFGGDPKITMKHLGAQSSTLTGAGFLETSGAGMNPDYAGLYDAANTALAEIEENFNLNLTSIRDTLSGGALDAFNSVLQNFDFSTDYFEKNWNYDLYVHDAEGPLKTMLTGWAEHLNEGLVEAYESAIKASIKESDIAALMDADAIDTILNKTRYDSKGTELSKTEALSAAANEFQEIEAYWNTLVGTLKSMGLEIEGITSSMTSYESAIQALDAQFDSWKATLTELGFAEETISQIECRSYGIGS